MRLCPDVGTTQRSMGLKKQGLSRAEGQGGQLGEKMWPIQSYMCPMCKIFSHCYLPKHSFDAYHVQYSMVGPGIKRKWNGTLTNWEKLMACVITPGIKCILKKPS